MTEVLKLIVADKDLTMSLAFVMLLLTALTLHGVVAIVKAYRGKPCDQRRVRNRAKSLTSRTRWG